MKINAIKREIPAAISEEGGAQVVLVGKDTTELETSIAEALDGLYVIGDKLLVKGFFIGLMKSMIEGVQRDGHARQLADFLTVYPVVQGEFDLDKGWDPEKNSVKIRVRLMNEMSIDISSWEFVDVTPGRQPFRLESVKGGDTLGVVVPGEAVELNGKPLPLTGAIRVDWTVPGTDRAGTVPAAKVTSTVSRADIAADALDELKSSAYDGKTIEFTVRGNFANAKISAMLKYVEPPAPTHAVLTDLWTSDEDGPDELSIADGIKMTFDKVDPDGASGSLVVNGVKTDPVVTVDSETPWVMWTFGRDELVGESVTFKFRYEDGTETGEVVKTIHAAR